MRLIQIKICTFQPFSDNEDNSINLLSEKKEFIVSAGKSLKLTTLTMDAGDIFILTLKNEDVEIDCKENLEVIKRVVNLNSTNQTIYLKSHEDESKIIEIYTGCSYEGEVFRYKNLVNLEFINLQEINVSTDKFFYKGFIMEFTMDRYGELNLDIRGNSDLNLEERWIPLKEPYDTYEKVLEKAKLLIDSTILEWTSQTDREKLMNAMKLPSNIRTLEVEEQNKLIIDAIERTNERLGNMKCSTIFQGKVYQLSNRQITTQNNAIGNINEKRFLEAYYEIVDFVENYGDGHDGKVFNKEKIEIYNLIRRLYNSIVDIDRMNLCSSTANEKDKFKVEYKDSIEKLEKDFKLAFEYYEDEKIKETIKILDNNINVILNNDLTLKQDIYWKVLTSSVFKAIVLNNFYNRKVFTLNDLNIVLKDEEVIKKNILEFCDNFRNNQDINFIRQIEDINDRILKDVIKILKKNIGLYMDSTYIVKIK